MKLLITGANGQVGRELARQAAQLDWPVAALAHQDLDITHEDQIRAKIAALQPDAVINAAAYTAVDRAEGEAELAFAINRDGPANLAVACAEAAIPLVHYSTDYIFDGTKKTAYIESDAAAPLGVYGHSKQAGEEAVRTACPQHLILRTSWVFSAYRQNFVKTMLRLGAERDELAVVADQFGKPTSASELARITLQILPDAIGNWGSYHVAQPDATSWHGFAQAIFAQCRRHGMNLKVTAVHPITTEEYLTPAARPANSELNCDNFQTTFGIRIRPWSESLSVVIRGLEIEGTR
ncbi:MAG: dTDP-4-dehydrorhamnose reductase [Mariprofundales bacterium]|nr:dTDP-4-dehydrorhamnose reductase [Mariprofundales bacterium]